MGSVSLNGLNKKMKKITEKLISFVDMSCHTDRAKSNRLQ